MMPKKISSEACAPEGYALAAQEVEPKSDKRLRAELNINPAIRSAITVREFGCGARDDLDLGETADEVGRKVLRVQNGDLSEVEAMLTAQAISLDGVFNEMAGRAARNFGQHMSVAETYLRLAFKAQAQCRATLETLAEMKYPKAATFIKQTNIAERQQVNNAPVAYIAPVNARTEEKDSNSLKRTIRMRNGT
jgi:hypothetical protein